MANTEKDTSSGDSTDLSPSTPADAADKVVEVAAETAPGVDEQTAGDAADEPRRSDLDDALEEASAAWDSPAAYRIPEPAPVSPAAAPRTRGSGVLAPVIGGVIAAAIGYGAAQYIPPGGLSLPGAGGGGDVTAALTATDQRLAATLDQIAGLQAQIAALAEQQSGGVEALAPELSALADRMAALTDRLGALDERVSDLAKAQVAVAGEEASAAVAAYETEIAAMREELARQREENAKLANSVASVATDAEAEVDAAMDRAAQIETRAALMRIDAALANGTPFDAALGQVQGIEVPDALAAVAADGVATLAVLQRDFPEAARAALAAAREVEAKGGVGDRANAFLRSQLGLRSLAPREGDDADAVLSRAEAALRGGDLAAALGELDALPDAARAAIAGWIGAATARLNALGAARALEQSLNN